MRNKKQKCSFQLKSPTPLIAVSSYFIFSTPISLLIRPRLTLHALQPMDSIGCASTLFCLLHFILAIDCQASQLKLTEMAHSLPKILSVSSKTLHSCSPLIMSSLRYYTPHTDSTNSRILFSKITLPNWPSSLPAFPSTFLHMTPNPLRAPEWAPCCPSSSQSLQLFYLQIATPTSSSMDSPFTRHSLGAHMGPSATPQAALDFKFQ